MEPVSLLISTTGVAVKILERVAPPDLNKAQWAAIREACRGNFMTSLSITQAEPGARQGGS